MKRKDSDNQDDTPKWWNVAPTTSIKRETEDAAGDLCIAKNINPKKQKKD